MFRRKRKQSDFAAEIKSHLELETEQLKGQGMGEDEARMAARRAFGNVTQAEERFYESGRWLWWDHLVQDLRFGLRMLLKNPGFTAVAVLTLALGIGANTAIFSLIDAVMLRILPVERPSELFQVKRQNPRHPGQTSTSFTNPIWEQVRAQQDMFSDVLAWGGNKWDLAQGGAVHLANGIWVSGSFFHTLGIHPVLGRLFTPADDQRGCPALAVLSYGFWQEHYGGAESALGSTLSLNEHPFQVVGVAPPGFFGMEVGDKFDVAAPICATALLDGKQSRLDHCSWWWLRIAGRIKPGISPAQVGARLKIISPAVFDATQPLNWSSADQQNYRKLTLVAEPAATGISGLRQEFQQALNILMAVVGLVLLIACANLASLMLARGDARQKEVAVRQAMGAGRLRLVCQILTECYLLSFAGAFLGMAFARWGTALLVQFLSTTQHTVYLDLSVDYRVLLFTGGIAVFTGVLFGLLPALGSTRVSLSAAMKPRQGPGIGRRTRSREWIVASQVAMSLVLLVAAGLLLRSFAKLAMLDIGFDRNNVLLMHTDLQVAKVPPDRQLATYEEIESRLRALPGVIAVGRSVMTPLSGGEWNPSIHTEWSKGLSGDDTLTWFNYVSPGFFPTLRMPLLAGRDFTSGDTISSPKVAIVNQTLARRFFPDLNPLGKTFRVDNVGGQLGPPIEVVGLVKDAKYDAIREDTPPTAFFPASQIPRHGEAETLEIRTTLRPSAIVSQVQAAIAGVNNQIPLEFNTLAAQANDSLVQERLLAVLSGFFGALALLLAMIGLYGTFSYLVARRQTEFGIRMALGAEAGSILCLVMGNVVSVLGIGIVAGLGTSLATTRVLQTMLFKLSPRDAVTMVGAAGVLAIVALAAGYLPARRATKVDPMVALREE